MDLNVLKRNLPNTINYQDLPRDRFFELLEAAVDKFQKNGDTKLIPYEGCCGECKKGCSGISFIGNNSQNYLDIIFETENDEIVELSECSQFIISDRTVKKNERIYIDDGSDFQNFLDEYLTK
ncbi:MAG: hypothetical protein H6602_10725 [Flavobacteriales bacterium]|nr:hypothetical protein [Flavobacteriales bacterium]